MNMNLAIPEEVDPANELERQLAVFYCRLNTWQHPLTGTELSPEEREWLRKEVSIMNAKHLARDGVNQRLWMQGRSSWTNSPTLGEPGE
jgi:hypothetical protein